MVAMKIYVDEYGITKYEYTLDEQKQRDDKFYKEQMKTLQRNDDWGGQGTISGNSNYGKFGDGGQS